MQFCLTYTTTECAWSSDALPESSAAEYKIKGHLFCPTWTPVDSVFCAWVDTMKQIQENKGDALSPELVSELQAIILNNAQLTIGCFTCDLSYVEHRCSTKRLCPGEIGPERQTFESLLTHFHIKRVWLHCTKVEICVLYEKMPVNSRLTPQWRRQMYSVEHEPQVNLSVPCAVACRNWRRRLARLYI